MTTDAIDFDFYARSAFDRMGVKMSSKELNSEWVLFNRFNPLDRSLVIANRFESRSLSQDVGLLISNIKNAVKLREGFSFLRMRDGEGCFVAGSEKYPSITNFSIALAKRIWFYSCNVLPNFPEFNIVFSNCYRYASMIGYSPLYRINMKEVW